MADLKITKHWQITLDGVTYSGGSATAAQTISGINQRFVKTASVVTTGKKVIFDVTTDLPSFDFLVIESNQDIEAEMVVADGEANVQVFVLPIRANVPFMIDADNSRESDHTEGWGVDGTADNIEKIEIKNSSGSTAQVKLEAYSV